MTQIHIASRLEKGDYKKIEGLVNKTKLRKAEIIRRLILIGLKHVKEPKDLLEI